MSAPTIGVFDSGFGGLTVLRSLLARMPSARYAFVGDTARLPYGSKSRRTIARYAAESAQFLVRQQSAEFLVIACNTASALALDAIKDAVPVPVLGVIEPGADAAKAATQSGDVLVIATDATVHSHAYAAACQARGLRALEKACPLLVPLVEEGWTGPDDAPQTEVTRRVIRIYLDEVLSDAAAHGMQPDTLLLGCTHYPLLRPLLEAAVPAGMRVIDSADSAADAAAKQFNGRASAPANETEVRCFATDSVEKFERLGSRFLGRPVGTVELVDLGG
ncbi:MAG TPA: glutamate racemase [Terracidiphilus sp.]